MKRDDLLAIRKENGKLLKKNGYRVLEDLPLIEEPNMRSIDDVKGRVFAMHPLCQIGYGAPPDAVKDYLERNGLTDFLSSEEMALFQQELSHEKCAGLTWYIENIYAFLWALGLVDNLDQNEMAQGEVVYPMLPDLPDGGIDSDVEKTSSLRSEVEIAEMLDCYYRLHWHFVDERINGRPDIEREGIVFERRKALEWLYNRDSDWDSIEMST